MRFCVLGSIGIDPQSDSGLGGSRQRRLLAALLVEAGEVVSTDRLAEIVFEGEPSDAAAVTLRSYVARLRKTLGSTGASVITRAPGYVLELGEAHFDARMFEAAVKDARTLRADGQMVDALEAVSAGLHLWGGRAYAEFADEDWVQSEAIRLDELRVDAEELRLRCLVDLGRHSEAISDLVALAEAHPLRESCHLLLMTSLYRAGRQADALRAASSHRAALVELGLQPTADFDDLEDRIVVQDPDLSQSPPVGHALRGYRLGERLGGRDGAQVHTALQPGVERVVVIKTFDSAIADSRVFIDEFERRVQEVARLEHRGLVEILDFWREPGAAHLVTRLVRGERLASYLDKGPLAVDLVAQIVADVAAVLVTVHSRGIWHGHIEVDDVLFDEDGSVLLAGVGTTEIVEAARREEAGGVDPEPGPARDQYALALLAYRALTGHQPNEVGERRRPLPRVSDVRPELLALDGVLARAGAPSPGDRYPDIAAFARSFADAVGAEPPASIVRPAPNPYKGLRAFDEADSREFFGRERLTTEILDRMSDTRLLSVIGPSGSGKSSVVLAGVAARVRGGSAPHRKVATMVPGAAPFDEMTRSVRRVVSLDRSSGLDASIGGVLETLRAVADGQPLLLIIDQFEELYTRVDDRTERARFIDGLMDAVDDETLDLRVLLTLRADFFDRPLEHHRLGAAISDGAVAIPGMSPADIERAVVEPAAASGVTIEGSVVAEMVADVVDQPAALPLLQFSLTELFESRAGDRITLEDHVRLGGVAGAIAQRAERLYSQAPGEERDLIRILFLRLVTVGEVATDLRRRTDRSELVSAAPNAAAMDRVIDRFGAARLLAFDRNPVTREPTVEVAHEALLRHWPRLGAWVEAAGRDLHLRSHLTRAAAGWETSGRDEGELYRGARLNSIEEWIDRADLTTSERSFLEASLAAREAEQAAELALAEQERRSYRRVRVSLIAVASVLVVAVVAGFVAVGQRNRAQAEVVRADEARGRTLGVISSGVVADDRSLSLLLAVEASRLDPDTGRGALMTAIGGDAQVFTRTVIPTPANDYMAIALSPDGSVAAAKRASGLIDIVDLERRAVRFSGLPGPAAPVAGLDISDDGRWLVSSGASRDGIAAVVYGLADGVERYRIPGGGLSDFHQAVFAPGSSELIVSGVKDEITIREIATGELIRTIDVQGDRLLIALDVSGRTAYVSESARINEGPSFLTGFDIDSGELVAGPVAIEDEFVVRIDASGDRVVTAGGTIAVFEAPSLEPVVSGVGESLGGGALIGLDVTPSGSIAVGSSVDLQLWWAGGSESGLIELPIEGDGPGVAFSPDGSTLVTADPAGSISTWRLGWVEDVGVPVVPEGPGLVTVSPDGELLAVWARGRGVQLFDRASLTHLRELEDLGPEDSFLGLDFSPDNTAIGTLTCPVEQQNLCDAVVELYDIASGHRIAGPVSVGALGTDLGLALEFTADGDRLAVAAANGEVVLLDVPSLSETGERLSIGDVASSPGPRTLTVTAGVREGRQVLAALGQNRQLAIWDITADPVPLGSIEAPSSAIWFTPSGELVVGYVDGPVQMWDPLTVEALDEPLQAKAPAWRFSMSEQGVLVVDSVPGAGAGTRLYDVASGRVMARGIPAFGSDIDPGGAEVYLGAMGDSQHGLRVAVLPLDVDALMADACAQAGRNLTREEWSQYMPADADYQATCENWPIDNW